MVMIDTPDAVSEKSLSRKQPLIPDSEIDPEMMVDGMIMAGFYIEAGATTWTEYVQAMLEEVGEGIKPYLRLFYEAIRHYPGFDTTGMSTPEEIERCQEEKIVTDKSTPEVQLSEQPSCVVQDWPVPVSLEWNQVRQFFRNHGCVVSENPEMDWYRESWCALENAGLTCTVELGDRTLDQFVVKLRAICLLGMYLGIYQVTGEYSEFGGYFSDHEFSLYMDTLDLKVEEIRDLACHGGYIETAFLGGEEDEEMDADWLIEIAMEMSSEPNTVIFEALKNHYGGDVGLFASLWNSRLSKDEKEDLEDAINPAEFPHEKLQLWEYVQNGMIEWWWV